jgi:hypothetical protein
MPKRSRQEIRQARPKRIIGIPKMPFDEALRKILKAPPQHRKAKKPRGKK